MKARGFSLVEVLVSLVVFSLGLLGVAGLLVDGIRHQSLALRHATALSLVAGMSERVRANPAGAAYARAPTPLICDETSPCDAGSLAAADLQQFAAAALAQLPQREAQTFVTFEPATGPASDRYVITLRWRETPAGDATDEVSLTLLAQPPVAGGA